MLRAWYDTVMFRTRDLILYVLVLLFLLMGIAFTVALEKSGESSTLSGAIAYFTESEADVAADTDGIGIDRAANIAKLRDKIARGEGQITAGPPVFSSVDQEEGRDDVVEENPDALIEPTDRSPAYCSTGAYDAMVAAWPQEGVTMELVEGARLVAGDRTRLLTTGSSTVSTTTRDVLLQLPLSPMRGFSSHCLPATVVGVALDGTLIKNDETWRFRSVSSESVIGYALDGFPIYGEGIDESRLDSCGGYDSGVGYRYHLREKELFVLACFAAPPQPFIE